MTTKSSKYNSSGGGASYDFRNVLAGLILSKNDNSNSGLRLSLVDFSDKEKNSNSTKSDGHIPMANK